MARKHEGRDERIEWWRDDGFGCFIHWNASSLLGSEWKGEVYQGYAEHIQRMAKITQQEYMDEVISKFNPVEFDAEEWVRVIKDAGMRYVVFTAKHHDGFAMWDFGRQRLQYRRCHPLRPRPDR